MAAQVQAGDEPGYDEQELYKKLFIGGLSWSTTKESLQSYFQRYGEVADCIVMRNPTTGNSRGFGFVTYKDPNCVDTVLASKPHVVDGKTVDAKPCNPRAANQNRGMKNSKDSLKLFVGGIPPGITEDEVKNYFNEKFGGVLDFVMMYDHQKQRARGFGFLTFENEETVSRVLQEHYFDLKGKQVKVEVKKFENPARLAASRTKSAPMNSGWGNNMGGGMGWGQQGWGQGPWSQGWPKSAIAGYGPPGGPGGYGWSQGWGPGGWNQNQGWGQGPWGQTSGWSQQSQSQPSYSQPTEAPNQQSYGQFTQSTGQGWGQPASGQWSQSQAHVTGYANPPTTNPAGDNSQGYGRGTTAQPSYHPYRR